MNCQKCGLPKKGFIHVCRCEWGLGIEDLVKPQLAVRLDPRVAADDALVIVGVALCRLTPRQARNLANRILIAADDAQRKADKDASR